MRNSSVNRATVYLIVNFTGVKGIDQCSNGLAYWKTGGFDMVKISYS